MKTAYGASKQVLRHLVTTLQIIFKNVCHSPSCYSGMSKRTSSFSSQDLATVGIHWDMR